MSRIIPYDDTLEVGKTVFITPEDKIIITDEKHEIFAQNYCEGNISKLTKGELILYKHWLEQNDYNKRKMCSDFLVDVLGFDKILTNMRKSITTTTLEPHMRFYNYYLMDWYIDIRKRSVFNEEKGIFEFIEPDISSIKYIEERRLEDEIRDIKSKVKLKDRHYFFK